MKYSNPSHDFKKIWRSLDLYSDYNKERRIAGGENALTLLGTDLEGQFSFIAYKDGAVKVYKIKFKYL